MTPEQIRTLAPNALDGWPEALCEEAPRWQIVGALREAAWLANCLHETAGLTRFEENLNYRAERIVQVWPSRFRTLADAAPYAHAPERLANAVYAGKLGNVESGDGWKFRGRGPAQLTGRDAYRACAAATDLPLLEEPDLLLKPVAGARSAGWFWRWKGLAASADAQDIETVRRRWSGSLIGLDHVRALYEDALRLLAQD